MNAIEQGIGLTIVEWVQQTGGDFLWFLLYPLHLLVSEISILILLPLVYWCIHKEAGKRLFILVMATNTINAFFKGLWQRPRPFTIAPERIKPIAHHASYGLPSGHTMLGSSVGVWAAAWVRKKWFTLLMAIFIVLMGVSRMVHGVHYPQDVLLGWILGLLLGWIFIRYEHSVARKIRELGLRQQVIISIIITAVVFLIAVFVLEDFESKKKVIASVATLGGGLIGIAGESETVGFNSAGVFYKRILRGIVGLTILAGFYVLLRAGYYSVANNAETIWSLALYLIRYAILGCLTAWGIPYIFVKTGLAEQYSYK